MTEIANNNIDIEVVDTTSENAQYFWHNTTDGGQGYGAGAHITQVPKEDFIDDPDNGGGNTLITSTGLRVRDGLKDLAEMSKDGFDAKTYDAQGNEVVIAHLGYGPGADSGGGTSDAPYYTLGERLTGSGIGNYSHAEGKDTTASGFASHVEGSFTKAQGDGSHAEGLGCISRAYASHSEGDHTEAQGESSHSQNISTIASMKAQTVIGSKNVIDTKPTIPVFPGGSQFDDEYGNYALIIGNGHGQTRSNALTVDWQGGVAFYDPSRTFFVTTETFSYSAISNGSSSGAKSVTFSPTYAQGYYPIGIMGLRTGNSAAVPTRFNLSSRSSGSGTFTYVLRAVGSVSAGSGDVDILWVKET